jgi:cobalamin-dependent methionine synthase I
MAEFVDALRTTPFTGVHFKKWQSRVKLWLTAMGVFCVSNGKSESQLTPKQEKSYEKANTLFVDAVIGALADHLQDVYLHNKTGKELWDALSNNYGGLDADTKLYIIDQYHNYKMADGKGVVEQTHEIHCTVKELEILNIIVPDEFVTGCIIVKLP